MKKLLLLLFIPTITFSQVNTEIHLFDLSQKNDKWLISNGKNISNNQGYDSQPHFYNDTSILFASTRNNQTDILKYHIDTKESTFISNTPKGGEYSPQKISKSKNISAVRLDDDGLQRFYKYDIKTGKPTELIKDLVVAYPLWFDKNT